MQQLFVPLCPPKQEAPHLYLFHLQIFAWAGVPLLPETSLTSVKTNLFDAQTAPLDSSTTNTKLNDSSKHFTKNEITKLIAARTDQLKQALKNKVFMNDVNCLF